MAESLASRGAYADAPPSPGMTLADLGRSVWDFLRTPYAPPNAENRLPQDRPVRQTPFDELAQNVVISLATLPQRAIEASNTFYDTGYYDPAPIVEAATIPVAGGMPLAVRGALGSAGGKMVQPLAMDEASRLSRARAIGYERTPFYRGESSGAVPRIFKDGAYFSRDYEYSKGFAARGGRAEPQEYRLNLQNAFSDHAPVTADVYARLVAAAKISNPKLAADMVEQIAPGKNVDWFMGFARHHPQMTVAESGALVRQAINANANRPLDVFRRAGFDALDSGRDVLKISGAGIRSKDAMFDPRKAKSQNIMHSLGALGAGGTAAANYPRPD